MRGALKALRNKYGKTVRLVYRHLPLEQIHSAAWAAAEASECAAEQGKFWPYHDLIFEYAKNLSKEQFMKMARQVKIRDMKKFKACVEKGTYKSLVRRDVDAAESLGISGTPAFFVGRDVGKGMMEGELLSGAQPLKAFVELVESVLDAERK